MTTIMDPTTLPGMPAPFWFVQFFKVVGFTLHMIPMGLWFAGLPVAIGCALWNCKHSSRYARRMFGQFPVVMALGINFGIVPLLFLQTTYYKSFYTATILMGWHWLAVIPILIVGYYALYLAAGTRLNLSPHLAVYSRRPARKILFGVIASLSLIAIGLLITNGLTLMVRSDLWPGIMERTGVYGATTGLANNMRDPAVWIRFATMFALGLMTTGVWAAFDSHFLLRDNDESNEYRRWTVNLATLVTITGFLVLFTTAILIKNGIGGNAIEIAYPEIIFGGVVASGLLTIFLLLMVRLTNNTTFLITAATIVQICILATFAIMRQIGQNTGVASYVDVTKIPTAVQWSPLIAFLVCFVLGLLVIAWMVRQCVMCSVGDDSTATTGHSSPN